MTVTRESGQYVFDTAIGRCRLEWRGPALTRVSLVGGNGTGAVAAPASRPPAYVRQAAKTIQDHLAGHMVRLEDVPLAIDDLPPFHQAVYRACRQIPTGRTVSYGALAAMAGSPGAARAVGQAMRRNPFPLVVPCHRVLPADGSLGSYSARGGVRTKRRLLEIERAAVEARDRGRESRWPFDVGAGREHVSLADPVLGSAIAHLGGVRYQPQTGKSPFPALFRAIVYQQLSGKAAGTILGRVLAMYSPKRFPDPTDILATPEADLRQAGLSRNKTASVRDLAARTLDGTVPSVRRLASMDDETIIERLVEVRGIGRWTAEMFLISRLGRPDVMPVDDLGIRKGFGTIFGGEPLPSGATILERAERWRPYRTVATWYLWQATDSLLF